MFSTEISITDQLTKQMTKNDGKDENLCWENINKSLHVLEGEQISAQVAVSF